MAKGDEGETSEGFTKGSGRGVKVWKVGLGDGGQSAQFFSTYEVLTWTVGGILWFIQQELLHLYKLERAKV